MINFDKVYRFCGFTLNPAKRRLTDETSEIKLRDKDFDVLLYLLENAPKTCAHDEIIEHVWKNTNVENSSLEKAIANVRRALLDNAREPRIIKTVRTRGYLFVGDVSVESDQSTEGRSATTVKHVLLDTNANVAGLPGVKKPKYRPLKIALACLVGVLIICGLVWWKGAALQAGPTKTVLFADDFSASGAPDAGRWRVDGKTVTVANGTVRMLVDETDNWGRLTSVYFPFDRSKPITIRSRVKVMYSENLKDTAYFHGYFGLSAKTTLEDADLIKNHGVFGVKYCNYDYESKYADGSVDEQKTEGFFLVGPGGDPTKKISYRDHKVSPRIQPKWNQWFDQILIYEPFTGQLTYFIDGQQQGALNVGPFTTDLPEDKLRVEINPEGWWLYHLIEVDYVEVTQ